MRSESFTKKDLKMGVGLMTCSLTRKYLKEKGFIKGTKHNLLMQAKNTEKLYRLTNTEKHS